MDTKDALIESMRETIGSQRQALRAKDEVVKSKDVIIEWERQANRAKDVTEQDLRHRVAELSKDKESLRQQVER